MRDKSTSLEKGEPSKGSGEQGNGGVPTSRAEGTGHGESCIADECPAMS